VAYRIFISHGWRDRWVAEQIGRRIESDCGAEVFIDAFALVEGDDIEERIFAELPGCNELLALATPWCGPKLDLGRVRRGTSPGEPDRSHAI
jgi:hypothetical protein